MPITNHNYFILFQIDEIKLIRNHETSRSQGYGFITVSVLPVYLDRHILSQFVFK